MISEHRLFWGTGMGKKPAIFLETLGFHRFAFISIGMCLPICISRTNLHGEILSILRLSKGFGAIFKTSEVDSLKVKNGMETKSLLQLQAFDHLIDINIRCNIFRKIIISLFFCI
jgi:hypothetical protein